MSSSSAAPSTGVGHGSICAKLNWRPCLSVVAIEPELGALCSHRASSIETAITPSRFAASLRARSYSIAIEFRRRSSSASSSLGGFAARPNAIVA